MHNEILLPVPNLLPLSDSLPRMNHSPSYRFDTRVIDIERNIYAILSCTRSDNYQLNRVSRCDDCNLQFQVADTVFLSCSMGG
jgi:hypothetical protein